MDDLAPEIVDGPRRDEHALLDELRAAGCDVRSAKAIRCAWHDDANPSAGIYQHDGAWLFKCQRCHDKGAALDVWAVRALRLGRDRGELVAEVLREARAAHRTPPPAAEQPRRFAGVDEIAASLRDLQATYTYDVPGEPRPRLAVFRVRRGDGKTFLQAHHDGTGWLLKAPPKPWPLYRLGDIAAAQAVVVCEGEKAADALRAVGIPATTAPCGAGKAAHADWTPLRGKRVCVWPDHDDAGRKHAADVVAMLRDVGAAEVRMVEPTRLAIAMPPKGDAFDFLAALGDVPVEDKRAAVREVLRNAPTTGASRALAEALEDAISGRRTLVPLPWSALTALTRAAMPGAVTVIAGTPGAAKSFLAMTALVGVHREGHRVAMLQLEEAAPYWLQRLLAILARDGDLTDPTWLARNAEAARAAARRHAQDIDELGASLWVNQTATYADVGDWIEARCKAGARVLLVDPISVADAGKEDAWVADRRLMLRAKAAAAECGASVVFVSHPKAGPANRAPSLDAIAGGQAIPRLASTVLWVEPRDEGPLAVRTLAHGTAPLRVNRVVRILKARNAKGTGAAVGFWFDPDSLDWVEQGIVVATSRRSRPGDAGSRAARMASEPSDDEDVIGSRP